MNAIRSSRDAGHDLAAFMKTLVIGRYQIRRVKLDVILLATELDQGEQAESDHDLDRVNPFALWGAEQRIRGRPRLE